MHRNHFRHVHGTTPKNWVDDQIGDEIRSLYAAGLGTLSISRKYEWLTKDMVSELVDLRDFDTALSDFNVNQRREHRNRLSKQQRGRSNSNWRDDGGVTMPDVKCPECGGSLRKRAPNFIENVKRREVGNVRDRFVCEPCEKTFSRDEVVVNEEKSIQMMEWMSDQDE